MIFKDFNDKEINLIEEIDNCKKQKYDLCCYIGTDSQVHKDKKKVIYATCVVLHKKTKGGRIFIRKSEESNRISLGQRLQNETWKSVEVAIELSQKISKDIEIVIHIDCNKNENFKSSNYVEGLVGMVMSQGFKVFVKPDSWTANKVADRYNK